MVQWLLVTALGMVPRLWATVWAMERRALVTALPTEFPLQSMK